MDISWDILRHIIRAWAGASADLREVTPLEGGSISITLALTLTDGRKLVGKVSPHRVDRSHTCEAHQLRLLKEIGLPVPEVYAAETGTLDSPVSYILMEFVEGIDLGAAKNGCSSDEFDHVQAHLAELLLTLHGQRGSHFMRVTPEEPKRFDTWPAFYREIFDPIWQEVEKSNLLPVKARKTVRKVHDRLDRLIATDDKPRLLHWDVWSTNLLCRCSTGGRWGICALLDPNCKYGHIEAELSYIELFHTCTPTFMAAYQQAQRLPREYHQARKPIYQLYSLLNHVRLFGHDYQKPLLAAIERVGALV